MSDDKLKDQVALEQTMLENLKKLQDDAGSKMDPKDLEYPDAPSADEDEAATTVLNMDDVEVDDIDDLDDIDDIDLDDEDEDEDDDPTRGGFEIDEAALAGEDSSEEEREATVTSIGQDTSGMSKSELYKLQKQKELEEKKKKRIAEEKKKAEAEAARKAADEEDNILSVEELKKQAELEKSGITEVDDDDLDLGPMPEAPESSLPDVGVDDSTKDFLKAAQASATTTKPVEVEEDPLSVAIKQGQQTPPPAPAKAKQAAQPQVVYAQMPDAAANQPFIVRITSNIASIIGEIAKATLPAVAIVLFLWKQNQNMVTQKAINHIITGDPFQIELGLNMLKENFNTDHNLHYYELVKKRVKQNLDDTWVIKEFNTQELVQKMTFVNNFTFKDGSAINLPKLIGTRWQKKWDHVFELYESFYDTEKDGNADRTYVDNLRQANIFLGRKKCTNAYDKFVEVQKIYHDSQAALHGKLLAFHCAFKGDRLKAISFFEKRDAIIKFRAMQNYIKNYKSEDAMKAQRDIASEKKRPVPKKSKKSRKKRR